jgi:hypothetical protein
MRPNCTRLWIIELQRTDPEGARLLDAGITNNLSKRKDIQLVGGRCGLEAGDGGWEGIGEEQDRLQPR